MFNTSSSGSGVDKRPLTCTAPLIPKTLQPLVVDYLWCYLNLDAKSKCKHVIVSGSTRLVDYVSTPSFWNDLVKQLYKAFGKVLTTGSKSIAAEHVHEIFKQLVEEQGSTWYKQRLDCWRSSFARLEWQHEVDMMSEELKALTEEPNDRDTWFKYQNTKWDLKRKTISRANERKRREGFEDDPVYNVVVPAGGEILDILWTTNTEEG